MYLYFHCFASKRRGAPRSENCVNSGPSGDQNGEGQGLMAKTGRVAIVTGSAQGIGKRTAELLAERGYHLALSDLRSPSDTLSAVTSHGAEAIELVGDISDEAAVSTFAAAVRERWGRAYVLVNNAGISMI